MKLNIWRSALALLAAGALVASCEKEPQWELVETTAVAKDARTILVEEYTGQACPNCPQAATLLAELSKKHPANVITVAMHSKHAGKTKPQLESADAEKYATEFGISRVIPGVMINRTKIDGDNLYSTKKEAWTGIINKILAEKSAFRIQLEQSRQERTVALKINTALLPEAQTPSGELTLTIWVVEDIFATQQVAAKLQEKYLHNNVLRQVVSDRESYSFATEKSLEVNLASSVVDPENAKIVVFVADKASKEVYETAIIALGKGIDHQGGGDTPQPEPEKPTKIDKVTYYVDGTAIDATKDVPNAKDSDIKNPDGSIEMTSPYIEIKFPEEFFGKEVEGDFEMLDHKGSKVAGITSVCFGSCVSADFVEHFHADKFLIDKEQNDQGGYSVQLHFGLKPTAPRTDTYRVKMTIKSEGKEISTLTFAFTPEQE